jgi:hypothetical protein
MLRLLALGTIAITCAAACGSSTTKSVDASGSGSATFAEVYSTVISPNCSCHTSAGGEGITSGKLDMTSESTAFTNLVNVPAAGASCSGSGTRVVPDSAATSILFEKVNPSSTRCGSQMPLGGGSLSTSDVTLIENWINSGAKGP